MKNHYLFPGQLVVMREPTLVTTILGSCVAVVLYDPSKRIAGLNHYLLPHPADTKSEAGYRYGSISLPAMYEQMVAVGASPERLQAKVYGGARVVDKLSFGDSIGKLNVDYAISWLQQKRVPIIANDLGGNTGRKIIVNSFDFSVKHQLMDGSSHVDTSGGHASHLNRAARVVVVDDSASVRSIFSRALDRSGQIEVVGVARDAYEAREVIVDKKPDVVLLDIEMPGMSGVQFLEKLMQHFPLPTIMVSSLNPEDEAAVRALELGALEFVHKPDQFDPNSLRFFAESLVQKVLAAAGSAQKVKPAGHATRVAKPQASLRTEKFASGIQYVLVGGNGGAHRELEVFLRTLPNDTPPVLVSVSSVSALLPVFLEKWQKITRAQLKVAVDGLVPVAGTVYFAPPRKHLILENKADAVVMKLEDGAPVCLQQPSAERLFQSAQKAIPATRIRGAVAILLGGLGTDGVDGLLALREKGAHTIVSHPESSLFAFAPQAAISLGAADCVLHSEDIASDLMRFRSRAVV